MCGKGGGSPPVPSAASTTFNSTVQPNAAVAPLYQDFLNRANALSTTPFNPAQLGQVAPLNTFQTTAGNQLFNVGMNTGNITSGADYLTTVGRNLGNFDPGRIQQIMSPFTEQVVGATQNWFNNQNAIQGNALIGQGIRAGNAFGGDRAGIAAAELAGQQQLAQAPVIAGLRQAGYTQALDQYNRLKQFELTGAQAGLSGQQLAQQAALQGAGVAMGWGGLQQAQIQREFDIAQQNAMMQSAYPFQTLNWYGSLLGGVGPLMGQTAFGSNNPAEQSGLGAGLGAASAAIGLGTTALGALGGNAPAAAATPAETLGQKHGGVVRHRARGGLVPVYIRHNGGIIPGLAYGGGTSDDGYEESRTDREDAEARERRRSDYDDYGYGASEPRGPSEPDFGLSKGWTKPTSPGPQFPGFPGGTGPQQPQKSQAEQWLNLGTGLVGLATKAAPLFAMMSDPKTKTDVQRVGRTDDGEPLYGFRYKGDPKSYPKVVGPMARGPGRYQDGGDVDDDPLTMTDLGVLSPRGIPLPPSIAGPARGSPAGLPVQAEDMPNLARVRERFRPMLEGPGGMPTPLGRKFDINATAEVGASNPAARNFYQALTMDRAAARGEPLAATISNPAYYPASTLAATRGTGMGVSPALWGGANPANFATGNASFDPRTGRWVGFARGPQTATIQTGSGTELGGIEGPDLAAARRYGYTGPSRTAIGPRGPQGSGETVTEPGEQTAPPVAGPTGGRDTGTGPVGQRIPGAPPRQPETFAQRLATNPFWQFGTALMARPGIKGRELQGIGHAAQVMSQQQLKERERLLDEKPKLTDVGGMMHWQTADGQLIPTGMKSTAGMREEREERESRRKGPGIESLKVTKPGDFGPTTEEQHVIWDPETQKYIPAPLPQQQQPAVPQLQPAPQPQPQRQQPPAEQRPAPQIRQTEVKPAPQGWSTDPGSGNIRGPDGTIYDKTGKVLTPAPAQPTQTAQQPAQQPEQVTAGPTETQKRIEGQWASGVIKPGGEITNPAALQRNEAALQGLSPYGQSIVKGIADYTIDPNRVFVGKKAGERGPAMAKVMEYSPTYNGSQMAQRTATRKAFEATGVEARNIITHDMALQHADRAIQNIDALGHTRLPSLNEWLAKAGKQTGLTGDPYQRAVARVEQDVHAVSNELMKAFRGGGQPSEREAKRIADKLNTYDNPAALKEALREGIELLYGRITASAARYNDAMGPGYERPTEAWLSPEGRAAVQRILGR